MYAGRSASRIDPPRRRELTGSAESLVVCTVAMAKAEKVPGATPIALGPFCAASSKGVRGFDAGCFT
jgi:hypothetical protein